ncbi:hypothetical protein BO82DRAFT_78472 [Aspergillus uvarum CBS 121591]|uniref:Uncharacterized protein n=1 Tax=Aspergillus uvarum CBS 121591 TaxID=1448315 RepID=A0A319CSI7_9EURO|nr:hypothetical protein BO82DRAFT_78472 [Aspergillus uvarum CBS 121591]PYH81713.1 hypothetical protein BO82DRAFT_78472 [Aspergillus uvarum CBS 121591]
MGKPTLRLFTPRPQTSLVLLLIVNPQCWYCPCSPHPDKNPDNFVLTSRSKVLLEYDSLVSSQPLLSMLGSILLLIPFL